MLWATRSGIAYFFANLEFLCRVRIGEDRQTVDSRERKGRRLFVHILGGKYVLYTPGSYTMISQFRGDIWRQKLEYRVVVFV